MSKKAKRKRNRSGDCQCPTCDRSAPLVEHHIHGRKVHRWNESWNISFICSVCHDLVHMEEIIIVGWYRTSNGRELIWYKKGDPPPDPEIFPPARPHAY